MSSLAIADSPAHLCYPLQRPKRPLRAAGWPRRVELAADGLRQGEPAVVVDLDRRHGEGLVLALQLCFRAISGLLRRHGSEVTGGGRRDRGCAGAVGRLASGGEAAGPGAVHAGAGGGGGGGGAWGGAPGPRGGFSGFSREGRQ